MNNRSKMVLFSVVITSLVLSLGASVAHAAMMLDVTPVYMTGNIEGCTSNVGFSTVTGKSCATYTMTVQAIIPGCATNTGFSVTTGESCADNPPVMLNVLSVPPVYDFGAVTLKAGSTGDAVKQLQLFLNANAGISLAVDGKFGPKTVALIKIWQKSQGLSADGIVGPKTKVKMDAEAEVGN